MKTYVIIPDQHASPGFSNERADWAGQLLVDVKPDVVVNLGDAADMASLSSYDKGTRRYVGKLYKDDILSHLEFQERLWAPVYRQKKKRPKAIVLEGNHEHRIERALDLSPELVGTIGFSDYRFDDYYDMVVRYSGGHPGIIELDGILFAHYFISGISGRPTGGEHPAHMLLSKTKQSSVAGHSHLLDVCFQTTQAGKPWNGVIAGCFQDYTNDWAGQGTGNLWKRGIAILRNVHEGHFDFQWVSIESLKKEYGNG